MARFQWVQTGHNLDRTPGRVSNYISEKGPSSADRAFGAGDLKHAWEALSLAPFKIAWVEQSGFLQ